MVKEKGGWGRRVQAKEFTFEFGLLRQESGSLSRHRARVGAGPGNREGTASSASECGAALASLQAPCLCDCRSEVAGQAGGARTSRRPHTSAGGTWSREGRLSSLAWLPGEPRAQSSRNATMMAFLWISSIGIQSRAPAG